MPKYMRPVLYVRAKWQSVDNRFPEKSLNKINKEISLAHQVLFRIIEYNVQYSIAN